MARLPSLNALRAFEAVIRLGSVTAAARALAVTPGAISHQIKLLEADLGVPLLVRDGRNVAATPEGRAGLAALSLAFEQLQTGVEAIRRAAAESALVVSVAPSFASAWLVPRLDRYWTKAPHVDIRIETKWGLTDFRHDSVDLAIRFGAGGYAGFFERRLMNEDYFPVCSPELPRGAKPLKRPEDLAQHVLLHVDFDNAGPDFPTWRMWLKAAGIEDRVDYRRGPRFQISDVAFKAARDGKGVALGSSALVADDLERGRLIRPFPQRVVAPLGYHLVCPPRNLERPLIAGFIEWLLDEAASFEVSEAARRPRQI